MRVYLVQHGEAEPEEADPERRLCASVAAADAPVVLRLGQGTRGRRMGQELDDRCH